jgi:hypothetical protein
VMPGHGVREMTLLQPPAPGSSALGGARALNTLPASIRFGARGQGTVIRCPAPAPLPHFTALLSSPRAPAAGPDRRQHGTPFAAL